MINNKTVTAIVLVAGNSTRYGQNRNKNFEIVNGNMVLYYSLYAFDTNSYVDNIIVVAKEDEQNIVAKMVKEINLNKQVTVVTGGNTRQESVYNAISKTDSDIVIIHDGARPAIKQKYIDECVEAMKTINGVTIGVKSKDTIKVTDKNNIVIQTTKRENTWIIQTPQCFNRKILLDLHKKYKEEQCTDDCMLLEKAGEAVKIIEGDYFNIKITTYEDIKIISELMK